MAVRATMQDLILRLRKHVSDPVADPNNWTVDTGCQYTNQQLQDALDERRTDVKYMQLRMGPTYAPGGGITYKDFYATPEWESDAVLTDASYNVLVADTSEWLVSHFAFNNPPAWPVFMSGKSYDTYAAAADVLTDWAAQLKLRFDFGMGRGDSFSRSQQVKQVLELAEYYRSRQQPISTGAARRDANAYDGSSYRMEPYEPGVVRR